MITFKDISGNQYQAQATVTTTSGVNGEKSLTGVIYFGEDVKKGLDKGWSLFFDNEEYVVVTYKKNDQNNTVSFSAVQIFFYTMKKTGFYEEWNGSHTLQAYLDAIFNGTHYSYNNSVTANAFEKQNWGMANRLSLFNDIIDQVGCEFYVKGNVVYIMNKIGSDLSTIVRKKFNLKNAEIQTDNSAFSTYGRGFGAYKDANDTSKGRLSVEYKSPLYDLYGQLDAEPIVDERYTIADNLLDAVKKKVDESYAISLTISLVDLQNAGYDYAMANAGDMVTVIDETLNFDQEVRIIKVTSDYDINGNRVSCDVECGSLSFAEQQKTGQATIDNIVNGSVTVPNEWLSNQVQIATNALLDARTELQFTDQGIIAVEKGDRNKLVIFNSAGLGVSTDGGKTFENAITGNGINATVITTGSLKAINIIGSSITGSRFMTTNPEGFTIDINNGALDFNGPQGVLASINNSFTDDNQISGVDFNSMPGYGLSLNQSAGPGKPSHPLITIPKESTYDDPFFEFSGPFKGNLKSKDDVLWITGNQRVVLSGNNGEGNQLNVYGDRVDVLGNFTVYNGSKNAAHVTRDGLRATPAYETAESYLGDIGESNTGEQSSVTITIDELFSDIINTKYDYQVFVTPYSNAAIWVEQRNSDSFVVRSNKPNAQFGWELKAKRRGYEKERLVKLEMTYDELRKMSESEGE